MRGGGGSLERDPPLGSFILAFLLLAVAPIVSCGEGQADSSSTSDNSSPIQDTSVTHNAEDLSARLAESDVVVLGKIDACWVCQFDSQPHLNYTQVLAGAASQDEGQTGLFLLTGVAETLLPPGRIPIYKSQKNEICFLKSEAVRGLTTYKVVDVWEEKRAHLDLFNVKEG